MDHKTFINGLSRLCGRDNADTERMADELIRTIRELSSELDTVAVPGFGSFTTLKSEEYITTDNDSGKTMLYPPKVAIHFTAGSMLKKRFNHE